MAGPPPDPDLLDRFRRNHCTDAEHQRVWHWLQTLPFDEQAAFLDDHQQQLLTGDILPNVNTDRLLPHFMTPENPVPTGRQLAFRPVVLRWAVGAAAALALLWSSRDGLREDYKSPSPPSAVTRDPLTPSFLLVQTTDQPRTVQLPDSSRVTLAERSSLRYPNQFTGNQRDVTLAGEGFFAIRRMPTKPFTVHTATTATRVLGTSFTVRARAGQFEEVIVRTGRVRVAVSGGQTQVSLRAGQRVRFNRRLLTFTPVQSHPSADGQMASRQPNSGVGKPSETFSLAFNRTPLSEVARALESEFNLPITLATPDLADIRVTARLRGRALPNLLNQLEQSAGIRYTRINNSIIISKP